MLSKRTAIAIFICSFISESVWADSLELTPLGNESGCINAGQDTEVLPLVVDVADPEVVPTGTMPNEGGACELGSGLRTRTDTSEPTNGNSCDNGYELNPETGDCEITIVECAPLAVSPGLNEPAPIDFDLMMVDPSYGQLDLSVKVFSCGTEACVQHPSETDADGHLVVTNATSEYVHANGAFSVNIAPQVSCDDNGDGVRDFGNVECTYLIAGILKDLCEADQSNSGCECLDLELLLEEDSASLLYDSNGALACAADSAGIIAIDAAGGFVTPTANVSTTAKVAFNNLNRTLDGAQLTDGHIAVSIVADYACTETDGSCDAINAIVINPVWMPLELDRQLPTIEFTATDLQTIYDGQQTLCSAVSGDLSPTSPDAVPSAAVGQPEAGSCIDLRQYAFEDTCGNRIQYEWRIQTPKTFEMSLIGKRCVDENDERCYEASEIGELINDNDTVSSARLHVLLDDPDNCVDQQEFVLKIADENGDFPNTCRFEEDDQNEQTCIYFGSGDHLERAGTYQAVLTATSCGQGPTTPVPPLTFTIAPKAVMEFAGPYTVLEGESLTLSPVVTLAETDVNNTVNAYKWDLNGDNIFRPGISDNSLESGHLLDREMLPTDDDFGALQFDTSEDGEYQFSVSAELNSGVEIQAPNDCQEKCSFDEQGCRQECEDKTFAPITEPAIGANECPNGGTFMESNGQCHRCEAPDTFYVDPLSGLCRQLPGACRIECVTSGPENTYIQAFEACIDGCTQATTIIVTDAQPSCTLPEALTANVGDAFTITGTVATAGSVADPLDAFEWNFDATPVDGRAGPPSQSGLELSTPTVIFTAEGLYTVELTLNDEDSSTVCTTAVNVIRPPIDPDAVKTITLLSVGAVEGDNVEFAAVVEDSATVERFIWDFGDGRTLTESSLGTVNHQYQTDGTKTVCLTAEKNNTSAVGCIDIEIGDVDPIAEIDAQFNELREGEVINFSAVRPRRGAQCAGCDVIEGYGWTITLPSGITVVENGEGPIPFVLSEDGDYSVALVVSDTDSASDPVVLSFSVSDAAPSVASPSVSQPSATEGETVTFNAGEVTSQDEIVGYRWTIKKGQEIVLELPDQSLSPSENPELCVSGFDECWGSPEAFSGIDYTFPDDGTYFASLTVADADLITEGALVTNYLKMSESVQVEVLNNAPLLDIRYYPEGAVVEFGDRIDLALIHIDQVRDDEPLPFERPTLYAVVDDQEADFARILASARWAINDEPLDINDSQLVIDTLETMTVKIDVTDNKRETDDFTATAEIKLGSEDDPAGDIDLRINKPGPRFFESGADSEGVSPKEGREGELLSFSIDILVPSLGDEEDALAVNTPEPPEGMTTMETDIDGGKRLLFEWTPSYYAGGPNPYTIVITATADNEVRTLRVPVTIADTGRPLAVALGGTAARANLSLFEFEETNNGLIMEPIALIDDLGLGLGELAYDAASGFLFVSVPESDRVAVIDTATSRLIRRIPVNRRPAGLVVADGFVWVVHHGDNSLIAISPTTLKVVANVPLPGLENPTDVVALPDGFDGFNGSRLIVTAGGNGSIGVIDPQKALQLFSPVDDAIQLGGYLTGVSVVVDSQQVAVTDESTRRLYVLSPSSIGEQFDAENASSFRLNFAARDLTSDDQGVWVALGGSIGNLIDGGLQSLETSGSAICTVDPGISQEERILVYANRRINLSSTGGSRESFVDSGSEIKRLLTIIAPLD